MFVQANWLSVGKDEDDVLGKMSAAWAVKGNLEETLSERTDAGGNIQFRSGDDLLIIGDRESIPTALASAAVRNLDFVPAKGQTLAATWRRKTHEKAKMLSKLPGLGLGMVMKPTARTPDLRDMWSKVIEVQTKTYTIVHIVSWHPGTDDFQLPPSTSGAQLALMLQHYLKQ